MNYIPITQGAVDRVLPEPYNTKTSDGFVQDLFDSFRKPGISFRKFLLEILCSCHRYNNAYHTRT